jgi:sterol desaturase/sphingolipid hydroxylase (fatty acid hydroxylase superfamily)
VPRSPRLRELQLHLEHHAHPTDPHTNVTPLSFSVPVTLLLWGTVTLLVGSIELGTLVTGGGLLGYVAYELIHFSTHMWTYDGGLIRYWRAHHFEHHRHPRTCYGFTSPLWDIVFRTTRRPSAQPGSGEAPSEIVGK